MRKVIVESPYAGNVAANVAYARRCLHDSLRRGEAPLAFHLLYTQEGVLDDDVPEERARGIAASQEWYADAVLVAVYVDHGTSPGMHAGIAHANLLGIPVERRLIGRA